MGVGVGELCGGIMTCTEGEERFTLFKMFTLRGLCGFMWRNARRSRRLSAAQRRQHACFGLDTEAMLKDCDSERLICRTLNLLTKCDPSSPPPPPITTGAAAAAAAIRIAENVDSNSSPDKCNGDERGRK